MKTLLLVLVLLVTGAVAADADKDPPKVEEARQAAFVATVLADYRRLLSLYWAVDRDAAGEPPSLAMARETYRKVLENYRESYSQNPGICAAYDKEIKAIQERATAALSKDEQRIRALLPGQWRVKCPRWNDGKSVLVQFAPNGKITPDRSHLKVGEEDPAQYAGFWVVQDEMLRILTERFRGEIPLKKVEESFSMYLKDRKLTVNFVLVPRSDQPEK
jgi:hypothetical protein